MKKLATLCAAFALTLVCAATASAQTFSYGITAGLNLTKLKYTTKNFQGNLSSDNRAGWFVGPKVAFNTALGIGIDAALEYSERSLYMSAENTSGTITTTETKKYRTLEIPINVRYNIGLGSKAGIYVATGPQFGFALQNMNWSNFGSGNNFSRNNLNTTWNIGAGVRLLSHLEAGVGYNFALGKVGKGILGDQYAGTSTDAELEYKSNTFQVQLTYLF